MTARSTSPRSGPPARKPRRRPYWILAVTLGALALLPLALIGQQQAPGSADEPVVGVLRLSDLGTAETLQMLEQFTGKPILRQQTLPNVSINFNSQRPLTLSEAVLAVESLLALNGIAITEVGESFLKAVPASNVQQQVPPLIEGSTFGYAPSQKIYSKFYDLEFLTPSEALAIVQAFVSQGAPIPLEKDGSLFVTDALVNLQRIEDILLRLDQPRGTRTTALFIHLEHTEASEIVRRLQALQESNLGRYLENNTTFDADERTNQVIAFTHPSNEDLIRRIIEKLDIDVQPLTTTEVYYIKHAEATEVASLLEQIITGQQQVREQAEGRSGSGGQQQGAPPPSGGGIEAEGTTVPGVASGERARQFSDFLTLTADERANAIIVSGTANDHEFLGDLIDKIDILLAQVKIEVVIAQVQLGNNFSRGIDVIMAGSDGISIGNFDNSDGATDRSKRGTDARADFTGGLPTVGEETVRPLGFDVSFLEGGRFDLNFVLGKAATNSDVKILQAPTIVTTHNREASISVGQSIPVITSVTQGFDGDSIARSNVQFREAVLELTVKPLIGNNGVIQLEISQKIEDQVDTVLIDDTEQPVFGTREATSFVGVADGQLIVLGGLQDVQTSETGGKMFLLGDLPIIGGLFNTRTVSEDRTELLIFIRPTVIPGTAEADAIGQQAVTNSPAKEQLDHYLEKGVIPFESELKERKEEEEAADGALPPERGPRR